MNDNNKGKETSFWPSFHKEWKPNYRMVSLLALVLFSSFIMKSLHLSPRGFNIFIGILWVLMLLNTVGMFKQNRDKGNTIVTGILMAVMVIFLFFFTVLSYL